MAFTVSVVVAQSPCCKNKAKGVSCKNSAQVVCNAILELKYNLVCRFG